MKASNPVVYSTENGRICPECALPVNRCICKSMKDQKGIPSDGIARIRREKQGRKGKEVTTISGISGSKESLQKIAAEIKKRLGTGGTVRNGIIEIQGDRVDFVLDFLNTQGFKTKKVGG